jgi:predicted metal-dependent HD superfamily phosphohydrolase
MKNNLESVLETLEFSPNDIQVVTEALKQPHRKFHTVERIEHLISLAIEGGYNPATDTNIFEAIVFKDVVFDPKSERNEELSASAYKDADTAKHSGSKIAVYAAILAAKSPTNDAHESFRDTAPWVLDFLDYDLEALANNFYGYSRGIYEESAPYITNEQFFDRHLSFLKALIQSKQIFWNHPEWEKSAREKIEGEIGRMEVMLLGHGKTFEKVSGPAWGDDSDLGPFDGKTAYLKWLTLPDF